MVSINEQLGNYRLLRLLGKGGFAEVYLGQHLYLKSYSALKVLRTSIEDEDVAQFMAEAQTLARLAHPHIVRVLDFDVIRGFPMLVMEYSPGGTLRHRYPPGSCLSLETTVRYIKQVASALQYAHDHDVIHRDVKPENILLENQEYVRLSDFGIALFAPAPDELSTQGMVGTVPYMAPEQLQGKPCLASDQYALGILSYEWLCGARPFEGNYLQLAYQHISSLPPSLRQKDPSLPESVEAVVLKALAKDPQQRYASIQLFAQALEQAAQAGERELRDAFEVTAPLRAASPAAPPATTTIPRKVLLSAFSNDRPFVARLSADLQARGVIIWDAHPEPTQPTDNERETLRQAMRAVDALLFVASPVLQSSDIAREHLQLAAIYKRPIIYIQRDSDETIETLPLVEHISIVNAHPAGYEAALDEIVAYLEREHGVSSSEEVNLDTAEKAPRNPYKGLLAFGSDDARDFFGRDTLITELTNQLRDMLSSTPSKSLRDRLLTVIGPSGSGKSSVVMAGLLPRLASGALPASDRWVYLDPIVPGTHPIESLSLTLASHFPNRSVKSIREDLEDDAARGLHLLAAQLVKLADQKVVLLVDQFEELFTLTPHETERRHFIDLLVSAVTEPGGPLLLILTLRADFYDRPMAYPGLGRLVLRHQCLVLPMEMHELRAAVKQPAALPDVQLSFEGNLVGDLLYEVQGQPGTLPLLQFTLDQLFQRRNGSLLTLKAYHEIGGVKGALAKHAETTYAKLPSEKHRVLARSLFLRLVDPGFTEQDTTRRRAPLDELTLAEPEENELLQQVMAYFLAARLLITSVIAGISTVEVSHETLFRAWPRLADWLWEAREDVRLQQAISEDVAEWEQRGQPQDRLYRGSQLKEAQAWVKRNTPSKQEAAFIHGSAKRRVRAIGNMLAIVLFLVATTGLTAWLFLRPPAPTEVTTLKDVGAGSLPEAIAAAKPGDTITFAPGLRGTIMLHNNGGLTLLKDLTIRGPGADILAISSSSSGNTISITKEAIVNISGLAFKNSNFNSDRTYFIANSGTLTLTNCEISHIIGGGISNEGTLTLTNSTVSDNFGGGGIYNGFIGTLILRNSILSHNSNTRGSGDGGGITNDGTVTLTNSTVSDNSSTIGSGGISNRHTLTLTTSTVSGNSSTFGSGGISNFNALTLTNSTVSGNNSSQKGGGIGNYGGGKLTLTTSTVSGNSSNQEGGGIFNSGKLTLTTSTVSGNSSGQRGGGIANYSTADITFSSIYGNKALDGIGASIATINEFRSNPRTTIKNSIIYGNLTQATYTDVSGTLTTEGYNLLQSFSGVTFDDPDHLHHTDLLANQFPSLGIDTKLRNNKGPTGTRPTPTLALLPGSPLIDQIPPNACLIDGKPTTDQRGVNRPQGKGCDIGAYEYKAA